MIQTHERQTDGAKGFDRYIYFSTCVTGHRSHVTLGQLRPKVQVWRTVRAEANKAFSDRPLGVGLHQDFIVRRKRKNLIPLETNRAQQSMRQPRTVSVQQIDVPRPVCNHYTIVRQDSPNWSAIAD